MSGRKREKFVTQASPVVLADVRQIAPAEGRQLQGLVDEARSDLVEKPRLALPRPRIMAVYGASYSGFGPLYKKLAE